MDIDAKVDHLFHKKRNVKKYFIAFGVFLVSTIIITLAVLPVFDEKKGLFGRKTPIQSIIDKSTTGEQTINGSAYHYWYAPENSFGIQSTKTVNFTFWKKWLKKYFSYELEARGNNESEWQNVNSLLNVNLSFNTTNNSCKVTLTLNTTLAPKSLYYRFTLVANRSVISHINKSVQYQYTLNLSANATENYSLVYNYSDLVPYIESGKINIKQDVKNNYFYQRIKTNKKIAVNRTFVIDPWFGWQGSHYGSITIRDTQSGTKANNTAGSGTIQNITAFLYNTGGNDRLIKCAIYYENGTFIDETIEKTVNTAVHTNITFWFTNGSEPTCTNNTIYYLYAFCEDQHLPDLLYSSQGQVNDNGGVYSNTSATYPNFLKPCPDWTTSFTNRNAVIWASFTEDVGITWQVIDDSINGTLYNQTAWRDIDTSLNGTLYNQTQWRDIDNTLNGTLYNSTIWRDIDTSINGTLYNISAITWQVIDDTINGSLYNITSWKVIDDTINGSLYNQTAWRVLDDTINGTLFNDSFYWKVLDDTINGTLYNTSIPAAFNITDEYPANQSFIYDLQPTIKFNLTHPQGWLMNYTVYWGRTQATCTNVLATGTNVGNGTHYANEYGEAIEYQRYFYRIEANDSADWVNETFNFNCSREGGGGGGNVGIAIVAIIFSSLGILAFLLNDSKRRK